MFIDTNDIVEMLGVSRSMVYKLMQNQDFPKPVKLGVAVRWDNREVADWIEAQKAKRHE